MALYRHWLAPQIDAHKAAHGAQLIQRFFYRRIREVEPVLEKVDPQHPFDADRASPGASAPGLSPFLAACVGRK